MKTYRFKVKCFPMLILTILMIGAGSIGASASEEIPGGSPTPTPTISPAETATPDTTASPAPDKGTDTGTPVPTQAPTATSTPAITPAPVVTPTPAPAPAPVPEATPDPRIQCGPTAWATLSEDGVLTVDGTGEMWGCAGAKQSVFAGIATKISRVVIGDGITTIGAYAFSETSCRNVAIGKGVKLIEKRAFYRCPNLTDIAIPANVVQIGQAAFRECAMLTRCSFSEGLQTIEQYAFCSSPLTAMTTLTLPNGLKKIGKGAFRNTAAVVVTIPASVESIEGIAFGKVSALIYSRSIALAPDSFASGSTLIVTRVSKAEAFAKTYGLNISYLECEPDGGTPSAIHTMDSGVVVKEATCVSPGQKMYTCTRCGLTQTETINCIPHTYGSWAVLSEPTVYDEGLRGKTCTVCGYTETVVLPKLEPKLVLNIYKVFLNVGDAYKLKAVSKSKGDFVKSWKSSDKKIVSVTPSGKVTAKAPGKAAVTVKMDSGISADVQILVKKIPTKKLSVSATGVQIKKKKVTVKVKQSFRLVPKVNPSNTTDELTYSSSKEKVAVVNKKGKVTAKKKGKTKITVKSGKKKIVITVTVK